MIRTLLIRGEYFIRSVVERLGTLRLPLSYKTFLIPPFYRYTTDDCWMLLRTPHLRLPSSVKLHRISAMISYGPDEDLRSGDVYMNLVQGGFYFVRVVKSFGMTFRLISHEASFDQSTALKIQDLARSMKMDAYFDMRCLKESSPRSGFIYRLRVFNFSSLQRDEIGAILLKKQDGLPFSINLSGMTGFGTSDKDGEYIKMRSLNSVD